MTKVMLHFEVAPNADAAAAARALQDRLGKLSSVEEAEASPEEPRMGVVELAGMIGAAVVVVKNGRELVTELRKIIPEIKKLVQEIRGLKGPALQGASIEIGTKRVPLDQITDRDLEELAD